MSGFSKEFLATVRKSDDKALSQAIVSQGQVLKYLDAGEHEVRVSGVDRNRLSENIVIVKFANDFGKEHNERYEVLSRNRKTGEMELGWKFAKLLACVLPSADAMHAFLAEVAADVPEVLDTLIGMRCKVTLKRGKGYVISYENGKYTATESDGTEVYGDSTDVNALKESLKNQGIKRAYLNVDAYNCTHGPQNIKALELSLVAIRKPKVAKFGVPF